MPNQTLGTNKAKGVSPKLEMRYDPAMRDEIEAILLEAGTRNELDETIKGKDGKETISEFTRTAWRLLIAKRKRKAKKEG